MNRSIEVALNKVRGQKNLLKIWNCFYLVLQDDLCGFKNIRVAREWFVENFCKANHFRAVTARTWRIILEVCAKNKVYSLVPNQILKYSIRYFCSNRKEFYDSEFSWVQTWSP
jgi:hypothetical protein